MEPLAKRSSLESACNSHMTWHEAMHMGVWRWRIGAKIPFTDLSLGSFQVMAATKCMDSRTGRGNIIISLLAAVTSFGLSSYLKVDLSIPI